MDTNLELPGGWFPKEDIEEYRRLYKLLPEYAITAEIGVFYGRSICSVADIIKEKNISVHCFDAFGRTERTDLFSRTGRRIYFGKFFSMKTIFMNNISFFGIESACTIHEGISWEMMRHLSNEIFDFIFIDGDHSYNGVFRDITISLLKLKKKGVIAGDDYNHPPEEGLREAVRKIFGENNIKTAASFWIHYGN